MSERAVLDASVGVKWVRKETGSDEAAELLRRHGDGDVQLCVASHFCYEVLSVAATRAGEPAMRLAWDLIREARITIVELSDPLVAAAIEECERLGCSFYDAIAPALARSLDARLYSTDRRSHGGVPGVVLIG